MKNLFKITIGCLMLIAATAANAQVTINMATVNSDGPGYYRYMDKYGVWTVHIYDSGEYILTGTTTNKCVYAGGGAQTITLNNVKITCSLYPAIELGKSPVVIKLANGTVNELKSTASAAAVQVGANSTLTITGTGELFATGGNKSADIGGSLGMSAGNITINSGIIHAYGGAGKNTGYLEGGAGSGDGININGGTVFMFGGTITGNTAMYGGAINVDGGTSGFGTLYLNKGSIIGNDAPTAPGVYFYSGTVYIYNSPKIGSPSDTEKNGIKRKDDTQTVSISGTLSTGAYIGINPHENDEIGTVIANKISGVNLIIPDKDILYFHYLGSEFRCVGTLNDLRRIILNRTITNAAVTVAAPVEGATPQDATIPGNAADYTVVSTVWSDEPSVFAPSTV